MLGKDLGKPEDKEWNIGSGENRVRGKPCVLSRPVCTKTFSAHHGAKFRHVVRESGVFTHGKNSHEGGVVAMKRHFVL